MQFDCWFCVSCIGICVDILVYSFIFFFFQAEDGIRYLVRSRGLGDVYKRQGLNWLNQTFNSLLTFASIYFISSDTGFVAGNGGLIYKTVNAVSYTHLTLPTSDLV